MDFAAASLIIRQHMALIDEGIGPKYPGEHDARVLAEAVRLAGHRFAESDLYEHGLVEENPAVPCPARSRIDEVPCAHRAGHPRVSGPTQGEIYDHSAPTHGAYWNDYL